METAAYLDFEFNQTNSEKVNLVCCTIMDADTHKVFTYWLHHNKKSQADCLKKLREYKILLGYSCVAEARSIYALGANPLDWKWEDYFFEYRCLTNHNDKLQWGKQLVDGKVKVVHKPKPKWERTEGEESVGFKATHSLAEATYKLTGEIRDTEHKEKMRALIISDPKIFTDEEKTAILKYNIEDVEFLPRIGIEIEEHFLELDQDLTAYQYHQEAQNRGRYAAHTAIMECKGYPIDFEKLKRFSDAVPAIMYQVQKEINGLFPEIKPFNWNKKTQRFSVNEAKVRSFIEKLPYKDKWMLTDTGRLSLSLDAFTRFFDYKHDYPKDNFGAQFVRFLKLKQNLYGFVPTVEKKRKTFWDFVGPDHRVRPYLNPFGAQSSRSQPSSSGFMFLKPAWMRALVLPEKGKGMVGIDYGSQEFFIAALLANDENMIEAYLSGDVYLAFAKLVGMVPPDGTKSQYNKERDVCKSTTLGISYLMSKFGLAIKLSQDTGEEWDEDMAQGMIDEFYSAYPDLKDYQERLIEEYADCGKIRLPCGWTMWGDNENFRSVTNVGVQGTGASIMRKAVDLAVEKGLYIPFTLHDALYCEYNIGDEEKTFSALSDSMREAFAFYFQDKRDLALQIRLDPFAWSPDYVNVDEICGVPVGSLYLDKRGQREYEEFKIYFESDNNVEL